MALAGGGWVQLDTSAAAPVLQRFTATGDAAATEAVVPAGMRTSNVRLVVLDGGGFAITWQGETTTFQTSYGYTLPLVDVYARHYAADGQALGAALRVSHLQSWRDTMAVPTALAGGGYVMAWVFAADYPHIPGYRVPVVYLRVMNGDGSPRSDNAMAFDSYDSPEAVQFAVTPTGDGGFVLAWTRHTPGGTTQLRRAYDRSGVPLGPQEVLGFTAPG